MPQSKITGLIDDINKAVLLSSTKEKRRRSSMNVRSVRSKRVFDENIAIIRKKEKSRVRKPKEKADKEVKQINNGSISVIVSSDKYNDMVDLPVFYTDDEDLDDFKYKIELDQYSDDSLPPLPAEDIESPDSSDSEQENKTDALLLESKLLDHTTNASLTYDNIYEIYDIISRDNNIIKSRAKNKEYMNNLYNGITKDKETKNLMCQNVELVIDSGDKNDYNSLMRYKRRVYTKGNVSMIVVYPIYNDFAESKFSSSLEIRIMNKLISNLYNNYVIPFDEVDSNYISFLDFFRSTVHYDERLNRHFINLFRKLGCFKFSNDGYFRILGFKEYNYDLSFHIHIERD